MRISELILDGFKSYPQRTVISGWDPAFNAVTGLNGSGKSNILDSICFVLGITNLSSVRASNLQDLIYKRGQAGVTKASVTVMFDNKDKEKSPPGFESYDQVVVTRQIAMGGISKYLINGHKSTQTAVQNIFQSVQLNINNPNFLIMQGKITKVLNMKPPEILGLIEEAAGTSMFEEKKDKAIKTMSKKEKKMEEIQLLLAEEIIPKLDSLRSEKRTFLEYQKAQSEFERLSRLVNAYDWLRYNKRVGECLESVKAKTEEVKKGEADKKRMKGEIARMEKEVQEISKKRDKEMSKGGKVQMLDNKAKELAKELAKLRTQADLKQSTIDDEKKRIEELKANAAELVSQREQKVNAVSTATERFNEVKEAYDTSNTSLKQSEELLQTLLTGLSSNSESGGASSSSGYMGQLATAKSQVSSLGAEMEQAKLKIGHLERELKDKEPKAKKAQGEGKGLIEELERARKEVEKLKAALDRLDWKDEDEVRLRGIKDASGKEVRSLLEKRDSIKSRLAGLDFSYADPTPNFDRSKVKGLVATLINIDQDNFDKSTALEVCAGGRLYNVVVEDEVVGSQLLDRGKLQKRVTMIPLNKIRAFVASAEKLAAVQRVAPGKAALALSLIGYEEEVSKAMEFVFGNTLICPDAESAKKVTFHKDIRMKSVTFEGDIYDPSGTLSGGSKPQTSGILVKVQELNRIEKQLAEEKKTYAEAERELEAKKAEMEKYKEAKKAFDLKSHEVGLLEARLQESNATRILAEVDGLKTSVVELKSAIEASQKKQKEAEAECKRLQKEMDEFKNNKDSKLTELKADIVKKKADIQKQVTQVKKLQREVQTAELELEQVDADIARAEQEVAEAEASLKKIVNETAKLNGTVKTTQSEFDAVETQLKEETRVLSAFSQELEELDRAIKAKTQEISDSELRAQESSHDIEKLTREKKAAEAHVKNLEARHSWIVEEKELFGQAGSPYDFSGVQMEHVKNTCAELEERNKGMKKKVNPKVLNMLDSVEKKEKDLTRMLTQVLTDKKKIEETIKKLDDYKRGALQKTWEKVNGDFGNIFNELLPGNFSKLQPPEGQDITQGLEVKVRLGSVWKQSLTELSGGQRSLIALSLIMSLLQFKPAPLYILDEIDAALDLSHTQHIGQLFKNRFKGSQFIVVSLKEGLFTNANVLFKTMFRDGTSVVSRTVQRSNSSMYDEERENRSAAGPSKTGKGRNTGALNTRDTNSSVRIVA